jgi:ElaB/YqjD/DUF883 family membrane-anchored ribosome-binding protein
MTKVIYFAIWIWEVKFVNLLISIESFFKTYSIAKEIILVIIGAVFGGICTAIINNGAMRKQCQFDMQYKILKEEMDNVISLYKKVEALEIYLSFGDDSTEKYTNEIEEVQKLLLNLNERLRDKRKFVRKYLNATIVEKTALYVSDYMKIMYIHGQNGLLDFQIISNTDAQVIEKLRQFETNIKKLSYEMSEGMEQLIAPGIVAKIKRKLRRPKMFIEECIAIYKVHKKN